jgi:hypothetical protein
MDRLALALAAIVIVAAALYLVRRRRAGKAPAPISNVCQQHIFIFQGGQLSEAAVEAAKARFRRLLARGDSTKVDSLLQPGTSFAVQVRALAELGTNAAGSVLERHLQRRLTDDPLEQAWYWLDVAHGLRRLERSECLPALFCCFGTGDNPLAHFLAAEIACFPNFSCYLNQPDTPGGRSALRVLHKTLVGLRSGVQPHVVGMARLGEAIETVWDSRADSVDPLCVRVLVEALRLLERSAHAGRAFGDNRAERDEFRAQIERIAELADAARDYLDDAQLILLHRLGQAAPRAQADLLRALIDLRADTAATVLPLLKSEQLTNVDLAIESLAWSHHEEIGPWLCSWAQAAARAGGLPFRAILRALKQFPSERSEAILVRAAAGHDAGVIAAALASLGWWEPLRRAEVLACLQRCRFAPQPEVQNAAQAALARLGERHALQWFRQKFAGENPNSIHQAIQCVADEGILLLWPDLDRLADAEDGDVAYHACEALEQLRESCLYSASPR